MTRLVAVELRKMFDTRAGFWLMASVGIVAVLATARRHPVRRRTRPITYESVRHRDRHADVGHPADHRDPRGHQRVEPAQRPDDVHARAQPRPRDRGQGAGRPRRRRRVDVLRPGRRRGRQRARHRHHRPGPGLGRQRRGPSPTSCWPTSLGMLMGFMLGVLFRSSAAAIVGYFVYSLVLPTRSPRSPPSSTGSPTCSRGSTSTSPSAALFDSR